MTNSQALPQNDNDIHASSIPHAPVWRDVFADLALGVACAATIVVLDQAQRYLLGNEYVLHILD